MIQSLYMEAVAVTMTVNDWDKTAPAFCITTVFDTSILRVPTKIARAAF